MAWVAVEVWVHSLAPHSGLKEPALLQLRRRSGGCGSDAVPGRAFPGAAGAAVKKNKNKNNETSWDRVKAVFRKINK